MILVKPETLEIGDKFRLTGIACDEAERNDTSIYEVVNKNVACTLGAHIITKNSDGVEQEQHLMPWVKVYKVT